MNITGLMENGINITKDLGSNPRYCETLEVHLSYNGFIVMNFIYVIVMFLEMKRGILTKLAKNTGIDVKGILFIIMLIFNVCMFLFQFALLPLTSMVGG